MSPVQKERAPACQAFFGTPYLRPDGLTYSNKIWYSNTYVTVACF